MAVLRPTEETGVYEIEGLGTRIRLLEWRAGSFYDSVQIPTLVITAGTQLPLFQNLQNKNRQHTNLDNNSGRLPALNELICNRVGGHIAQAFGNLLPTDEDIIKVAHAAYMRVSVNQTRLIYDQPLLCAQSGYGITGSTTRNNTGVVTTGVASAAAAPQLLVAQPIGPNDSISTDSYIQFPAAAWLAGADADKMPTVSRLCVITVFLDGLVKKPATA